MVSVYLIIKSSATTPLHVPHGRSDDLLRPWYHIVDRHPTGARPTGEVEDRNFYQYQNIEVIRQEQVTDTLWTRQSWTVRIASCKHDWEQVVAMKFTNTMEEAERIIAEEGGDLNGIPAVAADGWDCEWMKVCNWWDVVEVKLERQPLGVGAHVRT